MSRTFALIIATAFGIAPVFAGENNSPWHSFVDLQGGHYDSANACLVGVEGGVGYETGSLVHYLFAGVGQVSRGDEPDHLDEFEFGYRATYRLNERTSIFAELGKESLSANALESDALGNTINLSLDSDHYFVGTGFRINVWKGLGLTFSCRYLPNVEDAAFARAGNDGLGNVVTVADDTPNFLVKLGIGYQF